MADRLFRIGRACRALGPIGGPRGMATRHSVTGVSCTDKGCWRGPVFNVLGISGYVLNVAAGVASGSIYVAPYGVGPTGPRRRSSVMKETFLGKPLYWLLWGLIVGTLVVLGSLRLHTRWLSLHTRKAKESPATPPRRIDVRSWPVGPPVFVKARKTDFDRENLHLRPRRRRASRP